MKKSALLLPLMLVALLGAAFLPSLPGADAEPSFEGQVRGDVEKLRARNGADADTVVLARARDGSVRQMRNGAWKGSGGSARDTALAFAREQARALGLRDGDAEGLRVAREVATRGGTRVTLQQTVQGEPVLNGTIEVLVSPDGAVSHVNNAAAGLAVEGGGARVSDGQAAAKARTEARMGLSEQRDKRGLRIAISGDAAASAQVVRADAGLWNTGKAVRKVHAVVLRWARPHYAASYVVDDATGTVLSTRPLTLSLDGSGNVFDPNPLNFSPVQPTGTFINSSPDNDFTSRMVNVTLREITQTGPNFVLTGPNVLIVDVDPPTQAPPSVGAANAFTFVRSNPGFSAATAYRSLDENVRFIHTTLGFPTVMNYALPCDVRGAGGADNSFYDSVTPGSGHVSFGPGGVPDAEDCDIVLHELGHAIQDNQTAGFYFYNGEAGAMGEGFGDFWAAACTYAQSTASGFPAALVGEWDATVYSPDDPPFLRRTDGNKVYPADMQNEVHADGEIWSAALWNVFAPLTSDTQRRNFLMIVLQSHFLVPDNPSFNQGGHALIDANAQLLPTVLDLRPQLRASLLARGIFQNNAPGNLAATAPSTGGVSLTWDDLCDVESAYQVLRAVGSGTPQLVASLNPDTTSYVDQSTSGSTTYTYLIKALDPDSPALSKKSQVTVTTAAAATPTPDTSSGSSSSSASSGGSGGGGGGGGCFIATAAYGTYSEAHVVTLRGFRDQVLMKSAPGRWFVGAYYRTSPPVADWIRERSWARAVVRAGLDPVVFTVRHPLVASLVLALLVAAIVRLSARRRAARTPAA